MNEFKSRQLTQMRFAIADFREGAIPFNVLLFKLEGAAHAVGREFWEQNVFDTSLVLEQINADVVEERRPLTLSEQAQVKGLISAQESRLTHAN